MGIYLIDYENTKKAGLIGLEALQPEDTVILFYSEFADTLTFEMHRQINESRAEFRLQMANVGTKNALDFELVTYLGYLIGKDPAPHYYIVSGDKGFQSVCKYWKAKNVKVTLVPNLTERDSATKGKKAKEQKAKVQKVAKGKSNKDEVKPANETKATKNAKSKKAKASQEKPAKQAQSKRPKQAPKQEKPAKAEDASLESIRNEVADKIDKPDAAEKVAKIIFKYKTKQGINNALMREFPSPENHLASVYYKAIKSLIKNKKGR